MIRLIQEDLGICEEVVIEVCHNMKDFEVNDADFEEHSELINRRSDKKMKELFLVLDQFMEDMREALKQNKYASRSGVSSEDCKEGVVKN